MMQYINHFKYEIEWHGANTTTAFSHNPSLYFTNPPNMIIQLSNFFPFKRNNDFQKPSEEEMKGTN